MQCVVRVVFDSPAFGFVCYACQRVHYCVEVGAYVEAVEFEVVACVAYYEEVFVWDDASESS